MQGLEFSSGPLAGQRIEVDGSIVAGREGDLLLDDDEVSRRHASLRPVDGGLEVEDLGSTNGTFINEVQISTPTTAPAGATVRLGTSEATVFVTEPADPNATKVAGAIPSNLTAPSPIPPPAEPEPAEPPPPAPEPPPVQAEPPPAPESPPEPQPPPPAPEPPRTEPQPVAAAARPAPALAAEPSRAPIPAPGPDVARREVATRLLLPEIATFATIGLVAVALIVYFASR